MTCENYNVVEDTSPLGWSGERLRWKVVELWTLSAEDLLTAPDLGVVPLASLAKHDGPPEVLFQRCRDRIDREGGKERENLLAVSQVFAKLNYDKPEWLDILGGRKMLIESPLIREIVDESERKVRMQSMLESLEERFGALPPSISAGLEHVKKIERLSWLNRRAAVCTSLQAFEDTLREELPKPSPASTRGKRRPKKSAE
jgi:hypothetical protein